LKKKEGGIINGCYFIVEDSLKNKAKINKKVRLYSKEIPIIKLELHGNLKPSVPQMRFSIILSNISTNAPDNKRI